MSARLPAIALDPEECRELIASARWTGKVEMHASGCHLWVAGLTDRGYAEIRPAGEMGRAAKVKAHRVAYVAATGEDIPQGLVLDHLCRVRNCVNPDHLEAVTVRDNIFAAGSLAIAADEVTRTHCPRGHALEGDNLVRSKARIGFRECRTCNIDRARERTEVVRAAARTLGMGWAEYVRSYGSARSVAIRVIEESQC